MIAWPVGEWIRYPLQETRDPRTGRTLLNVTHGEGENKPLYFNKKHFTGDGRRLVFTSNRTGAWQIYAFDLAEQRLCRLTDSPDDPGYPLVDQQRPFVYYVEGMRLHRVDIDTARDEVLYEHPNPGVSMFRLQDLSSDGKCVGLVEIECYEGDDIEEPVSQKFLRRYRARPLSRFWAVASDGATSWKIHEERGYLYHLQFNPADPSTILYCHEGPVDAVDQRMWLMKWDGSNIRPLRVQERPDITIYHEYWRPNGRSVVYLYQCAGAGEPWSVREIDTASGEEKILVVHPLHDLATDPSGRWLAADDPQLLWLFDLEGGTRVALAEHGQDIGMENQPFHPHAQVSPDGMWVDFSCRRGAANDVCLIGIGDLVRI